MPWSMEDRFPRRRTAGQPRLEAWPSGDSCGQSVTRTSPTRLCRWSYRMRIRWESCARWMGSGRES